MTEGHFEAIKYAYRQSKDGFVLSFVVHPNDMPDALATAPIGSRFMVAFAEIRESGPKPQLDTGPDGEGGGTSNLQPAKSANTADTPPPKPNSTRAVMMAKDPEFWAYVETRGLRRPNNETEAEADIKFLCNVTSKRELNDRPKAAEHFENLRRDFYAWRRAQ